MYLARSAFERGDEVSVALVVRAGEIPVTSRHTFRIELEYQFCIDYMQ